MAWNSARDEDDMGELFGGDVPSTVVPSIVPVGASDVKVQLQPSTATGSPTGAAGASSSAPYVPPRQRRAAEARSATVAEGGVSQRYHENTLDESVAATLLRDVKSIWGNLKLVCAPFSKPDELQNMLTHWDLWGPLIFTLFLAGLLAASAGSNQEQMVFSMVIIIVVAGAVILTVNVILLGGAISFFQSVCLLGYCLFPIDVAALVLFLVPANGTVTRVVRISITLLGLAWSMHASLPFVGGSVGPNRKVLAVYPVCLMYSFLSWLAIVT